MMKSRRRIRAGLVLLVTAWALLVAGGDSSSEEEAAAFFQLPGSPVAGGRIFMERGCVKCHAIQGLGGTAAPDLGKVRASWSFLDIAGVMWNHTPRMDTEFERRRIARPSFTSDEMFHLISFVYFLNYFGDPGDADRGRSFFEDKDCVACHSVGKHGPGEESPLDHFRAGRSPASIGAALWNANKAMTEDMIAQDIPRPEYKGTDIVDLLAFIRREAYPREATGSVYLPPGSPKAGAEVFQAKGCAHCHTVGGGGGRRAPDLGSPEFRGMLSSMEGTMWNHGPEMWKSMEAAGIGYPTFSAEEMSDLMTYLYFASLVDPPGDSANGQRLFEERGCVSCHGLSSYEDKMAQNVSEMELPSASAVIAAMWNHASEMKEAAESINVAWPQFKPGEMRDLVAFIRSRAQAEAGSWESAPSR